MSIGDKAEMGKDGLRCPVGVGGCFRLTFHSKC